MELPVGARPCKTDADCVDGVDCTRDECLPAGYCSIRLDHATCSDGLACNGSEACDAQRGCISTQAPTCDDQDPCTIDRCQEANKGCVHDPRDFDRDGEADYHCNGGTDCDDFDAARSMSSRERCNDTIDNDCDDIIDEADCGPIEHDSCADPLDVSAGGVFEISCVGARGDYFSSCAEETLPRDVVFTFSIDQPQDVKFIAVAIGIDGSDDVANLTLQRDCGDITSELQCTHGFPGDLRARALPPGRYYLIASASFAAQNIVLTTTYSAPTPAPPNRECQNALDVGKGGHFEGDFVDVPDKFTSKCAVEGQPELYYKVRLTEKSDIEVSAIAAEMDPLVVSLRKGCPPELDAFERCEVGAQVIARYHEQEPGDYYLVIEGPSWREISFALDVAISPPTPRPRGDSCEEPLPLTIGQMQRVSLVGLQADVTSTCQTSGPDAVMSLELPKASDVEVKVDGDDAAVKMALQSVCNDSLSERVCRSGMPLTSRLHDVPAGKYYLVVDSSLAESFTVLVNTFPATPTTNVPSTNDTCYSAWDIPETGGLFSGDTRMLNQDYSANCGGTAMSRDAAFRLTLTERKRVVATVDASFDSVLLRYAALGTSDMLCTDPMPACNDDGGPQSTAQLDDELAPGTYYFIVDGYGTASPGGDYLLDVAISPP